MKLSVDCGPPACMGPQATATDLPALPTRPPSPQTSWGRGGWALQGGAGLQGSSQGDPGKPRRPHRHILPRPSWEGRCGAQWKPQGEAHTHLVVAFYRNCLSVAGFLRLACKPANESPHVVLKVSFRRECGVKSIWWRPGTWPQSAPHFIASPGGLPVHPQHQWGWVGVGKRSLHFKENITKRCHC